jgi:hypothetical protein
MSEPSSSAPADGGNCVTKAEFARQNGWSKSYVTKLKDENRLVVTPEGRVLVAESLQLIQETARAAERASPPAVPPQFRVDRDRKEFYDAENARLDLEKRIGKLLSTPEVLGALADAAVTLRSHLEALPDRLAPQIAALGNSEPRIRALLAEHIETALTELSHRLSKMAELAKGEG